VAKHSSRHLELEGNIFATNLGILSCV